MRASATHAQGKRLWGASMKRCIPGNLSTSAPGLGLYHISNANHIATSAAVHDKISDLAQCIIVRCTLLIISSVSPAHFSQITIPQLVG
jgi:hypothetical protein